VALGYPVPSRGFYIQKGTTIMMAGGFGLTLLGLRRRKKA
jgi:hypothetical protein